MKHQPVPEQWLYVIPRDGKWLEGCAYSSYSCSSLRTCSGLVPDTNMTVSRPVTFRAKEF